MTEPGSDSTVVVRVSDGALAVVREVRAQEDNADSLALWIEIGGTGADSYAYEMYFEAAADAGTDDWTADLGGLPIVVPADSVERIRGSLLDVQDGSLAIENPNRPPSGVPAIPGPPSDADLTGEVAQRIIRVLEGQINPSIASHGGRADLVAVQDEAAYLRLSGGCAGCGMAAVTLSQGIEVALRESVPEITRVIDVTDHAAGTNPYYEPAKK
ncbi:MAG TPA: NifU family protein [Acidimicrobiales bacterium]|jgi:Fe/S biogenesis protein NfuA